MGNRSRRRIAHLTRTDVPNRMGKKVNFSHAQIHVLEPKKKARLEVWKSSSFSSLYILCVVRSSMYVHVLYVYIHNG